MDPICFLDPCPLTGDFAVLPYLWAQPCDLLGRKAMTNLDSILKSRDIHYFANKGLSSQSYDFSSSSCMDVRVEL